MQNILSAQCRMLLKDYSTALISVIDEIKREQDSPINLTTCESLAMEYKRRQGIKEGLTLLMQRLNTKSNVRD